MTATDLSAGWQLAGTAPDELEDPGGLDDLDWLPARVPGTVASALREAGLWRVGDACDFDGSDWWFRTSFDAEAEDGEVLILVLDGVATVSEVYLNGHLALESDSMFAGYRIDVTDRVRRHNELAICCRALTPLLRRPRRPRGRWRTRLVAEGNLRFYRTMVLGRAPGFGPAPPVVGPWKPVRLERRRGIAADELRVRSSLSRGDGRLSVQAKLQRLPGAPRASGARVDLRGPSGFHSAALELRSEVTGLTARGGLRIPEVAPWWPHTHGLPALHRVSVVLELRDRELSIDAGNVGFRSLHVARDLDREGLALELNQVPVFARGAVWTPPDPAMPCSSERDLARVLGYVVSAGMNMLRVPGVGCYEGERFYDLCDQLGILVWQDFMFANLDYPESDPSFLATVEREARQVLEVVGSRPSLAVLCGGSEVAQQVAMLGLDPAIARGRLSEELLPALVDEAEVDAPYIPSTPWGGDLPFRPDRGVANYYGVGAYLRPIEDARRSEVRFAAECLAFSNVPDEDALDELGIPGGAVVHHARWKAGVPRDVGAGWDFEDVRDHYLALLFGLDPTGLRRIDPERYLELSRFVTGEVMAEVFGEWRRQASPCAGALVLWLTDPVPGAGWGLLDQGARPKAVFHHLRRALAPIAIWTADEGLGGVIVHLANDGSVPLAATVRVAMYRELELAVEEVEHQVTLEPHSTEAHNVEELLGRFVDASWAYRFGPPAQDLIVASLERPTSDGTQLLSQSFRLPAGRPCGRDPADRLGLSASARRLGEDQAVLTVSSKRFAYGVRVAMPGFLPDDDAFSVEPGHRRELALRRVGPGNASLAGHLTALNLVGRVVVREEAA